MFPIAGAWFCRQVLSGKRPGDPDWELDQGREHTEYLDGAPCRRVHHNPRAGDARHPNDYDPIRGN